MAHFAILCRAAAGHVVPHTAIGNALVRRGHRVTLLSHLERLEPAAAESGLEWRRLVEPPYRRGWFEPLGWLPLWILRRLLHVSIANRELDLLYPRLFLGPAVRALEEIGVDGILADATCQSIGTAAERLQLPYVSISSLPSNWEPGIPPMFTAWSYRDTAGARLRNRLAYAGWGIVLRRGLAYINRRRTAWGLRPLGGYNDAFSPLAQIAQMVPEFDFPRREAPATLHYVGALSDGVERPEIDFPWGRLDGRRLIYASLGTVGTASRTGTFRAIAAACDGLDAQLVLSLGRWLDPNEEPPPEMSDLPGRPVVVPFAPQCALIRRAALVINVGGLNTTMDALRRGVPMLALPFAANQPGVASRLARTGAGLMIRGRRATVPRLRRAVGRLLEEEGFRRHASRLARTLADAGGAPRAAAIVEAALLGREPVRTADPRR